MARKGGNPDIKKHGFKKGDPRINRKGAPKKLPKLKALLTAILGANEDTAAEDTPIAEIINALVAEVKNKRSGAQRVAAAKEILDRLYGKVKTSDETTEQSITWVETKTYKSK